MTPIYLKSAYKKDAKVLPNLALFLDLRVRQIKVFFRGLCFKFVTFLLFLFFLIVVIFFIFGISFPIYLSLWVNDKWGQMRHRIKQKRNIII